MVKINFDILLKLKPEIEDINMVNGFWELVQLSDKFDTIVSKEELGFQVSENKIMKFSIRFKKTERSILCHLQSLGDIHWSKLDYYDSFRTTLSGLLNQKFNVTFFSRELSKYYAEKCYPIIYDYENNLRQLFYLIYHFNEIHEIHKLAKSKLKPGKLNMFVEDLDLFELEKLFFSKIWLLNDDDSYNYCGSVGIQELISEMSKLSRKPDFFSTWDIYIAPFNREFLVDEDKIKRVRNIRNKVFHHKEMSYDDWRYCKREVRSLSHIFHRIQQKIILNEIYAGIDAKDMIKPLLVLSEKFREIQQQQNLLLSEKLNLTFVQGVNKMLENIKIPKNTFSNNFAKMLSESMKGIVGIEHLHKDD
ncbi:hypothetical protein [Streptococcus massiliensis]|uniref:Apea-like HEPN domain-containing protein n=1 Tax=Streptococcus massiliensis TaxID=313439 RepID=A0A380KVR9_9STRE|nr:hypothetical protein [Streptococcus massiliensis]SUN76033.1 Uncharacterised protein [Streptococcus massiliensis]